MSGYDFHVAALIEYKVYMYNARILENRLFSFLSVPTHDHPIWQ